MRQRRYIELGSIETGEKKTGENEIGEYIKSIPYIRVYSVDCGPVFLKQNKKVIKLKYADCECKGICTICRTKIFEHKVKCVYFVNKR